MLIWFVIIIFIISLIALVKGASILVNTAVRIAKRFGVSEFIIGLTIVSIGTTIPELGTSIAASISKNSGIILGNIIGSEIANIGLILGIAAAITSLKIKEGIMRRGGIILFGATFLFFLLSLDGGISIFDSLFFLILFALYLNYYFRYEAKKPEFKKAVKAAEFVKESIKNNEAKNNLKLVTKLKNLPKEIKKKIFSEVGKEFLFFIVALALIIYGARYLIFSSVEIAVFFGIPETIIALIMISIGTSLPELSTAIVGVRKGYGNMILGNIIGANIINILLIIGIAGLINPINIGNITLFFLMPMMIFFSILLIVFIKTSWKVNRIEGIIFLILYVLFIIAALFIGISY